MRARRFPAWAVAAALGAHLALAVLLAYAPIWHLLPAPDPLAVDILVAVPPAPEEPRGEFVLVGAADLQEAVAGAVSWPIADPPARTVPRQSAVPRPVAPQRQPRATDPIAAPGAPAAPGMPLPSAPITASQDDVAAWQAALLAWVERHRRYPPAARFRQEEGVVRVRFELDASGRVGSVALEAPSGSAVLDAAAVLLFQGASLPAPPAGMDPARRSVSLPIRYRLE